MCRWCQTVYNWIEQKIWEPVRTWAVQLIEKCKKRKCKWYCLCCNKWLCWLVAILVLVVVWIVRLIMVLIITIVCIVCFVLCFLLCAAFWVFQRTPMDNCVDWCNTGKLKPWETEPRVDPQKPPTEGGPVGTGTIRNQIVSVTQFDQLDKIASWSMFFVRPSGIKLDLEGMPKDNLIDKEKTINSHLSECGCEQGAKFLLAAIFGYVIYCAFFIGNHITWGDIETGLLICLGAAMFGKTVGLIVAQFQLNRFVRQLKISLGNAL